MYGHSISFGLKYGILIFEALKKFLKKNFTVLKPFRLLSKSKRSCGSKTSIHFFSDANERILKDSYCL